MLLIGSKHFYVFIGYWIILFVAMHRPIPRGLDFLLGRTDLAIHLVLYFGLTVLGWRYLRVAVRKSSVRTLFAWGAVCITYGAFDEWLQQFVGRKTSLSDWLADTAGVVGAITILAVLRYALPRRRTPPE